MQLESLRLRNFRNYENLNLRFPEGVIVFFGANGQGKTNLMEAFHFILRGQSFRPYSSETLLLNQGDKVSDQGFLEAHLRQEVNENVYRQQIQVQLSHGKKTVLLNHKRVAAPLLQRKFPLVLFSPESLSAIKEGPEWRRQLVDELLATQGVTQSKILRDFKHALKTRNRVLREARLGNSSLEQTNALLESLDPQYLPLAAELTFSRLEALRALQPDLQQAASFVLQDSSVEISVDYLISSQNAYTWTRSEILSQLYQRSLELRGREIEGGLSLVGPQKHDLRFLFSGKDSRFYCSQGQQRALILSYKIAQILYHHRTHQVYPFLLLDDVLSELDPIRRSNLVGFLRDIPAQIFLTTTDLSFSMNFGDRGLHVFKIEKGSVQTGYA